MRCRKPQLTENIITVTNKSHGIPKIPMTQNVSKKWNGLSSARTINKF